MMYDVRNAGYNTWLVTKLDDDYETVQSYKVTVKGERWSCTCTAADKATCRHRAMAQSFVSNQFWKWRFSQGYKWSWENRWWVKPSAVVSNLIGER